MSYDPFDDIRDAFMRLAPVNENINRLCDEYLDASHRYYDHVSTGADKEQALTAFTLFLSRIAEEINALLPSQRLGVEGFERFLVAIGKSPADSLSASHDKINIYLTTHCPDELSSHIELLQKWREVVEQLSLQEQTSAQELLGAIDACASLYNRQWFAMGDIASFLQKYLDSREE